jgi:hypothetical protein
MRTRTLAELEGRDIPKPQPSTYLLNAAYRLYHVPLREFSVEALRIMIAQNIGLQYLIPLAIEELRKHPRAEGDFYPGDLLKAVLTADAKFWQDHPDWRKEVEEIAQRAHAVGATDEQLDDPEPDFVLLGRFDLEDAKRILKRLEKRSIPFRVETPDEVHPPQLRSLRGPDRILIYVHPDNIGTAGHAIY